MSEGCEQEPGGSEERVAVLRVSSKSDPNAVAGAIAGTIREKGACELQTIGAGALNQAVKAIAIARGFLAPSGIDLVARPELRDVPDDQRPGETVRAMVLSLFPKPI